MQLHSIYEVETIAEGMDHPECLAFDLAGNGVAGGEAGQLYRFRLDGHVEEVANTGGGIGGICVDGKNKVVECNYGLLKVQQVDVNGEISVLSSGIESAPFVMVTCLLRIREISINQVGDYLEFPRTVRQHVCMAGICIFPMDS